MNYEIRSKDLDKVEKNLKIFIKEITPEIQAEIEKKEKKSREKFKELKNKSLSKVKLEFFFEKRKDHVFFTDPAPESPIAFMRKRAGKKMAKFLEKTLKPQVEDIQVKWIKGE